ncbi:MAG: hypothetical protein QW632_00550 [Ignisphaera sp.]
MDVKVKKAITFSIITIVVLATVFALLMLNTIAVQNQQSSFGLCAMKVDNKVYLLYLADSPALWAEGYKNKDSIDFMKVGAIGIIFMNKNGWYEDILITMEDVKVNFSIYLIVEIGNKLYIVKPTVSRVSEYIFKISNPYPMLGAKTVAFVEMDPITGVKEVELTCTR